ncbi:hypothetical protein [Flavobacterium koreense]
MKKVITLLVLISFLMQSCYSYKAIDKNVTSKEVGKTYKIKLGGMEYKGKLIAFNDSVTTFKVRKSEMAFKTSEINIIKVRKLSSLKTIGFTTMLVVGTVGLFVATYDGPKLNMNNLNSPN